MAFGININDVRIVLVRPRNPMNIGAAARAMMNFGFEDLVLVSPFEPVWRESRAALKAQKLLAAARAVPRLSEAIDDRTLVIGTSSLSRRKSAASVLSLDQLSARLKRRRKTERIAVLFGSEKTGLGNEDLSYCHWIARIPTSREFPSMNLSQAVAVCCYELSRSLRAKKLPAKEAASGASIEEVTRLVDELERVLWTEAGSASGPGKARPETARKLRLRRMLLRWPLTSGDVTQALGMLRDLAWKLRQRS
ncbi:MAG: RNA methyltransferase [Acidobacteria bacterium]|nr:RNA methyltransferase [Acidobacteriota bacterium]